MVGIRALCWVQGHKAGGVELEGVLGCGVRTVLMSFKVTIKLVLPVCRVEVVHGVLMLDGDLLEPFPDRLLFEFLSLSANTAI